MVFVSFNGYQFYFIYLKLFDIYHNDKTYVGAPSTLVTVKRRKYAIMVLNKKYDIKTEIKPK